MKDHVTTQYMGFGDWVAFSYFCATWPTLYMTGFVLGYWGR